MATWDPVKLVALMERFGEDLHATGWTPADVAIACAQAGDAAGLGRDYNPATIGPVLVIHCGQDLVDAFRSIEAGTDAGRLAYLLSLDGAAVSG
jgi:hypothetical protein